MLNGKKLTDINKIWEILARYNVRIEKTARGIRFLGSKVLRNEAEIIDHFHSLYINGYWFNPNKRYRNVKAKNFKDYVKRNYQMERRLREEEQMKKRMSDHKEKLKEMREENYVRANYPFTQTKHSVWGSVYIPSRRKTVDVRFIRFPAEVKAKALALAKKNNLQIVSITGDWNGYGYSTTKEVLASPASEQIYDFLSDYQPPVRKVKSEADIIKAWAKRLSKLTGIHINSAVEIAKEKIDYKWDKIEEMQDRDYDSPSRRRNALIKKMERANPLRRIADYEHGMAILAAHNRHANTDYEAMLEEARDLAAMGEIDRGEVRDYARSNIQQ